MQHQQEGGLFPILSVDPLVTKEVSKKSRWSARQSFSVAIGIWVGSARCGKCQAERKTTPVPTRVALIVIVDNVSLVSVHQRGQVRLTEEA
jgi:hypothetical protein